MKLPKGVVIIAPNLRPHYIIASKEIVKLSNVLPFKLVLVPFPKEVKSTLSSYLTSEITYEEFINSIMSTCSWCSVLLKQYMNMRPVLEVLKQIFSKVKFEIICYDDIASTHAELMLFIDLISLIIRARITSSLNFDRLIDILSNYTSASNERLVKLTRKIREELSLFKDYWLMISDFKGRYLVSSLRKYGVKGIKLLYITPYVFTPLERLIREYIHSSLSADTAMDLVRAHVNFLWNYVLLSEDINDAYLAWLKENYPQEYLVLMSKLYD